MADVIIINTQGKGSQSEDEGNNEHEQIKPLNLPGHREKKLHREQEMLVNKTKFTGINLAV